jgi:hypothetical protein
MNYTYCCAKEVSLALQGLTECDSCSSDCALPNEIPPNDVGVFDPMSQRAILELQYKNSWSKIN